MGPDAIIDKMLSDLEANEDFKKLLDDVEIDAEVQRMLKAITTFEKYVSFLEKLKKKKMLEVLYMNAKKQSFDAKEKLRKQLAVLEGSIKTLSEVDRMRIGTVHIRRFEKVFRRLEQLLE